MESAMARAMQLPINLHIHHMSVADFEEQFADEDSCRRYLQVNRWPDGVRCPRCGNDEVSEHGTKPFHWQCNVCAPQSSYRFSVLVDTIFENTKKPLRQWFRIMHIMLLAKSAVSASDVQRYMGLRSYGTARLMCKKIRVALGNEELGKRAIYIEVGKTHVGGNAKNKHNGVGGRGASSSALVMVPSATNMRTSAPASPHASASRHRPVAPSLATRSSSQTGNERGSTMTRAPTQPDPEALRIKYQDQRMTITALAERYCVPRRTIQKWLSAFGISARRRGRAGGTSGEIAKRLIDTDGYVLVYRPGHPNARRSGYILESRLVMSELLGRPLLPAEQVLHHDGNNQNNDPANLYIANADHAGKRTTGKAGSHDAYPAGGTEVARSIS
jgi:hypothetical protein